MSREPIVSWTSLEEANVEPLEIHGNAKGYSIWVRNARGITIVIATFASRQSEATLQKMGETLRDLARIRRQDV